MSLKNYLHRGRTVTHSPGNYKSNYLEDAENGIGISECLAGPQGMDFHIWVPDIFKDDPILDNLITEVASKLLYERNVVNLTWSFNSEAD